MNPRHALVLGQPHRLAHFGALLALIALLFAPGLRAETFNCTTLSSLPVTISTPGHYCLNSNFALSGDTVAIAIDASDVVLDCNDHVIRDTPLAVNAGIGVKMTGSARNVTVRGCRIDGFYVGIWSWPGTSAGREIRVLNNQVSHAYRAGISLYGSDNLIEDNLISESLGTNDPVYPTGIYIEDSADYGVGNVIRGNSIGNFRPEAPDGSGYYTIGINVLHLQGTVIENNTVAGLYSRTGSGTYGITSGQSTGSMVRGNVVLSVPLPVSAPLDGGSWTGIFLQGTSAEQATNVCVDNQVGHFNGNVVGCVVAGNTSF